MKVEANEVFIMDGKLTEEANDPARISAFLPSDCVQNHAANLLELENGDLLCAWFAGTQEGMADIHVYVSRLTQGSDQWAHPEKLSDDLARSEQNPVLFQAPGGTVWLMYTAQKAGNQNTAFIRSRKSEDGGRTWSEIEVLFDQPGTFIRQPMIVLDNGEWLLPIWYCRTVNGEKWTGHLDSSAVKISKDEGKTWEEYEVPGSIGCVHMNIQKQSDGTLTALYRSRWADHIYISVSADNGRTWSEPVPTNLPNNNSSIQWIKLASGSFALVFNNQNAENVQERRTSLYDEIEDDEETAPSAADQLETKAGAATKPAREAFWGVPRAPLTLALSEDGGQTWPYMRNLEVGDGYAMTNNSTEKLNREYSYPTIIQSQDGKMHIAFTYYRQAIKYVQITEEWVKQN